MTLANKISREFNRRYRELKVLQARNKSLPIKLTDPALNAWCKSVRTNVALLSNDQISKLRDLGFDFEFIMNRWLDAYFRLSDFYRVHGHLQVTLKGQPGLGAWMTRNRERGVDLQVDRRRLLNRLSFDWRLNHHCDWDAHFESLKKYKTSHGDCNVPATWKGNTALAAWVCLQRKKYRDHRLPALQIDALNSLGFVWNPLGELWEQRIRELIQFKKAFGHCRVTLCHKRYGSLVCWVQNIRHGSYEISQQRKAQLEQLGFDWRSRADLQKDRNQKYFSELEQFRKKYGHCRVPAKWRINSKLGTWVFEVRSSKVKLGKAMLERLDQMGFDWDPFRSQELKRLRDLKEFKKRFGHYRVPTNWKENLPLANWLRHLKDGNIRGSDEMSRELKSMGIKFVRRKAR